MSVLRGVFGVRATQEGLSLAPNGMPLWQSVRLRFFYRGREIELLQKDGVVTVKLLSGAPCRVSVNKKTDTLETIIKIDRTGDAYV